VPQIPTSVDLPRLSAPPICQLDRAESAAGSVPTASIRPDAPARHHTVALWPRKAGQAFFRRDSQQRAPAVFPIEHREGEQSPRPRKMGRMCGRLARRRNIPRTDGCRPFLTVGACIGLRRGASDGKLERLPAFGSMRNGSSGSRFICFGVALALHFRSHLILSQRLFLSRPHIKRRGKPP